MTQQDDITQRVLTDDEIRDIITGTHQAFGEFKSGYMLVLGRAIESALLSKLRAPVSNIREGFELTYAADADDPACAADLSHFTNGWRACLMSQVRAPVADERAAVDPCGYVAVKVSAVDWLKDKFPALTIRAGLCERIGGRLYTITRLMRDHDAALASAPTPKPWPAEEQPDGTVTPVDPVDMASAPVAELRLEWSAKALYDAIKDVLLNHRLSSLVDEDGEFFPLVDHLCSQDDKTTESGEFEIALICDAIYNDVLTKSAPVAGEAVYTLRVRGAIQAWTPTAAAFSIPDGEHQLFLSPAAPQASAQDVRNAALEALEAARRFIRNGIEFGYIRMPDADKPDPAHRTPGMIDAAIRALKQPQADKDGGQQRAGDAFPDYMHDLRYHDQFRIGWNRCVDAYRAALSAPQAEQGERDA